MEKDAITAYREGINDSKRYKEFTKAAHEAKQKSRAMVNKLMEHARKAGDKKAVTTLQCK